MATQTSGGLLQWSRDNILTIAGIAGAAAVGYAIYFDHKRRSASDYKQKIREKRRVKANVRKSAPGGGGGADFDVPNPLNPADMQSFFLQEVQLGEELMSAGNIEEGAEHIANAVVLCGQGNQLLSIFQQTLPPEHFNMLIEKLPTAKERLADRFAQAADMLEGDGQEEAEDNGRSKAAAASFAFSSPPLSRAPSPSPPLILDSRGLLPPPPDHVEIQNHRNGLLVSALGIKPSASAPQLDRDANVSRLGPRSKRPPTSLGLVTVRSLACIQALPK